MNDNEPARQHSSGAIAHERCLRTSDIRCDALKPCEHEEADSQNTSTQETKLLSGETYYDYCASTEQMPIDWGRRVWEYLAPQLNAAQLAGSVKWIRFSKFTGKQKFALPVTRILGVYDVDGDGCCIVTEEPRGRLNTHVSQDYNWVVNQLGASDE